MKSYQKDDIKRWLMKHRSITMLAAFKNLGITRLAARIAEIEESDGIRFERRRKSKLNRYGRKFSYVEYSLSDEDREKVEPKWREIQ